MRKLSDMSVYEIVTSELGLDTDLRKMSAGEIVLSLHKIGYFRAIAKGIATTVLPFAAISGALSGAGQEGTFKQKVMKGVDEFGKEIMSPRRLAGNIIGWGVAPELTTMGMKGTGIANKIYKGVAHTGVGFGTEHAISKYTGRDSDTDQGTGADSGEAASANSLDPYRFTQ